MLLGDKVVVIGKTGIEQQEKSAFTLSFDSRIFSGFDGRNKMNETSIQSYSQCNVFDWDLDEPNQPGSHGETRLIKDKTQNS